MTSQLSGLVLVSGLGRCGTSLMMQMLAAGGWPVYGPDESTFPAFEHPVNTRGDHVPAGPGILKWLDPHSFPPPPFSRAIFLVRDLREQARSQVKLAEHMTAGLPAFTPENVPALARYMREEELAARAALRRRGPVLVVRFEDLIAHPAVVMRAVSDFADVRLDIEAAVRQVRPRPTGAACAPDMRMEESLIAESETTGGAP